MAINAVMYEAPLYETPGSAPGIAQRDERKESEQRQTAEAARDTVSISPEARERLRTQESGETDSKSDPQASDKNAAAGLMGTGGSEDEPESQTEKIQRQIRDLQKRIAEMNAKLAEAQSKAQRETESAEPETKGGDAAQQGAADSEGMAAVGGGASQAEAKTIQAQLLQMNQQLMELQQQLQEATKAEGGA